MYYVLFNYKKGERERDFRGCRAENDVISFLHEEDQKIDVCKIIEVSAEYRLGLIVTEQFIKSALAPGEEELIKKIKEKEVLRINKAALEDIEEEEEEELTDEEKEKAALKRADKALAAAKKDQRADWLKCPVCNIRPMAPWNKTGKCSYCQTYKKKKKDDLE